MAKKQKQQKKTQQRKKQEPSKKQAPVQQVVRQPEPQVAAEPAFMRKYGLWLVGLVLIVVCLVISFTSGNGAKSPDDVPQANVDNLPPLKVRAESSTDTGLQPNAPKQTDAQSSVQSGATSTQGAPSSLQGSSLTEREFRERGY